MTSLLEIREKIIELYSQHEMVAKPVLRFLMVLAAMLYLNSKIGYEDVLTGALPVLIVSLLGVLVPPGGMVVILGAVILVHLYSLSLEAAAVGAVLFLLMFLLYFRFSPKDCILLLLYPVCRMCGIAYVVPIIGGLLFTPFSALTSAVAVITDSYVNFVADNETAISSTSEDQDMLTRFRFLIDGILQNKEMLVLLIAVVLTAVLTYAIRRLSVQYSWYIAISVGSVVQMIVVMAGDMIYSTNISIGPMFLGIIASAFIAFVTAFFAFNLDYSRVENTQFQDDDYYYYVKAVPKMSFTQPSRTVKQISLSRHAGRHRDEPEEGDEENTREEYGTDSREDYSSTDTREEGPERYY